MDLSCVRVGVPVVTGKSVRPGEMTGSGVVADVANNRRPGSAGTVEGFIPEQNGEVWIVKAPGQHAWCLSP